MTVLLDSGAYSAWAGGQDIRLDDYVDFIKRHVDVIDEYVALDVIPGVRGIDPTADDLDHAAAASFENYEKMCSAGLRPIPVFHFGEDLKWLERMLEAGAEYVCLGGSVGRSIPARRSWMARCFSVLGPAGVRVHGLGATAFDLLSAFSWASVDSSTWAQQGGYGKIPVPRRDADDRPNYALRPRELFVTDDSPYANRRNRHIDAVTRNRFDDVRRYLRELGFSMVEARYFPEVRCALWAIHFERMAAATSGATVYFVDGDGSAAAALARAGARNRLVSFAWLRRKPDDDARRIVKGAGGRG